LLLSIRSWPFLARIKLIRKGPRLLMVGVVLSSFSMLLKAESPAPHRQPRRRHSPSLLFHRPLSAALGEFDPWLAIRARTEDKIAAIGTHQTSL
jgi:hypothetical protein